MVNYYSQLEEIKTVSPNQQICVMDINNIIKEHTFFQMEHKSKIKDYYVIKDVDNTELYYTELHEIRKSFIEDMNKKCLVKFDYSVGFFNSKLKLFINENNNAIEMSIKSKITLQHLKYYLEFFNNASDENELLEIYFSGFKRDINIYYGKEKEGGKLICKAKKSSLLYMDYLIEIAPGVDRVFILSVVLCFIKFLRKRGEAAASS